MDINRHQVQAFLKGQFKQGDLITKLILINIAVYLVFKIIDLVEWVFRIPNDAISTFISNWFYLPNQIKPFLLKFYTLLTYQFIHDQFWHILVNVLMLFFFGKLLLAKLGFKKFLPLYLLGGFFGGLLFVLISSSGLLPMLDQPMIGASASIMALMGAAAFMMPDYTLKFFLMFDVKLKWLVAGFAFLNLLSVFSPEGAGSGIIHLGGLAFGVSFMYLLDKGLDITKPFNRMVDRLLAFFNPKPKPRVTFVNNNPPKSKSKPKDFSQEDLDAILDKISLNGYDSLSKAEKEYLFNYSKPKS